MCRDPIMDIYIGQFHGKKVVMMDTSKVWIQATRQRNSRNARLNYTEIKMMLVESFPDIEQCYASIDKNMPVSVQRALARNGWKLMDWYYMPRIIRRNQFQQVANFSKLFPLRWQITFNLTLFVLL